MSTVHVLPGYAGYQVVASRFAADPVDQPVPATREWREPGAGYAPRRGVDAAAPVPPVAVRPAAGQRQAEFYRLRVRGRWLLGLGRARLQAPVPPVRAATAGVALRG